jgi:hypothetical protein
LAVALLSFFSPEHHPGRFSHSDVDSSNPRRDGMLFHTPTGAFFSYAHAACVAWKIFLLLRQMPSLSVVIKDKESSRSVGVCMLSGHSFVGLCGP